jgi:ATP-dependent RNA helicase MSS116, mitochondrial
MVYEIHSKKDQRSRTRTSDTFRKDRSGAAILVSSDVSARGVDYPGVTRVIQVGIPSGTEQYVHRIGRTGRAGTGGRGDLVLLPWEIGFVACQLAEMPLKPLTVAELTSQVHELAAKHDADRPSLSAPHRDGSNPQFRAQVKLAIEELDSNLSALMKDLDPSAIDETFSSLLGYYLGLGQELRLERSAILQGCKDWAMEACALPVPPYVSETFLRKLGVFDTSSKRFGGRDSRDSQRRTRGNWLDGGMKRSRPSWGMNKDVEHDFGGSDRNWGQRSGRAPRGESEDYPSSRRTSAFQGEARGYRSPVRRDVFGEGEIRDFTRGRRPPRSNFSHLDGIKFD